MNCRLDSTKHLPHTNSIYLIPVRLLLLVFILALAKASSASDTLQLFREIPLKARLMTVDETGNVYIVRENNSLVKFSDQGDSIAFYRSVQNGDIGAVDASNPLRVIVTYPSYSKLVILDRMLAQKNELDLRRLNIFTSPVVAASADGNLWIYDRFNARLLKIDEQLNKIVESNDLRLQLQNVPDPVFMVERDWKVYLADTARGIFSFDRYGNHVNTIALTGISYLQVLGTRMIYRKEDSLHSWDLTKMVSDLMMIPARTASIVNAAIVRNTLYVLYTDRLVLYRMKARP